MDPNRFDALARSLIVSASRRGVLAGCGIGLFATFMPNREGAAKRPGRHRKGQGPAAAENRQRGSLVSAEKKHKKKKKKKPTPCTSDCAGKTCGSDGCGGFCGSGSCGTGQSCVGGACVPDSGSCSPACAGGRECMASGTCVCPPDRPHTAPERFCDDTCRECCTSEHCHPTKDCDHNQGSICVCRGFGHRDCGGGFCSQCCTAEDCIVTHNFSDNVICTAPGNPMGEGACRCPEGLSLCVGDPNTCVNHNTDSRHCGSCWNVCRDGTSCINRVCRFT
jgi:hypothetical protein